MVRVSVDTNPNPNPNLALALTPKFLSARTDMRAADYQTTVPLKFLIIINNYVKFGTINQSKSLPGFWVVPSLDCINGRFIQTSF